jgi:hypothetical protein
MARRTAGQLRLGQAWTGIRRTQAAHRPCQQRALPKSATPSTTTAPVQHAAAAQALGLSTAQCFLASSQPARAAWSFPGADASVRNWVYRVAAALLVVLGVLTVLTGARTPVIWFKICPVLLASSAVLLLAASLQ